MKGLDELVGLLSESDSFYIMAAVVKMATSRPNACGGEKRFLTSVVLDILKVGDNQPIILSVICSLTRTSCVLCHFLRCTT